MKSDPSSQQKAQLDKTERERLEAIVKKTRSRVEDNVRFQLTQKGLDDKPENRDTLDDDIEKLVEAINIDRADDHTWNEALDKYTAGVGYTIVNRLAALRCMEVRGFIDEEVTVLKQNGLTPAAETLIHEEFLLEEEAIITAYHNTCDMLANEIEILFDRSSAYSLIDPDDDTFKELCEILNEVPDEVWRADDVLGWIYEYYNRPIVEALDTKRSLDPDDVGSANQFYTPHWVVRMLTDNSLGKLYLEASEREVSVPELKKLSPEERKERPVAPDNASDISNLCTYLIPDEVNQDAPSFDHPSEIRVIDPACGSGHFLLYAFDILERIWWAETDLDRGEIPEKILQHNLYGVDIDLRSCQLSAFNLYLKARTRAEEESNMNFEMPNLSIVCADARVAEVEDAADVIDQITGAETGVREALDNIIEEFQAIEALGSLLDVQGTLTDEFLEEQTDVIEWGGEGPHVLSEFLQKLEDAVEERTSDSFGERNLRDFLNLLIVLTQDYDVALMNPPYGSRGRMPNDVKEYVTDHYDYIPEYYINFFEACNQLVKKHGRIGMLVPRSFMFKRTYTDFRLNFVGQRGSFDFLSEFGLGILDNATVRTAGAVVRTGKAMDQTADFIRLSDVQSGQKENTFVESVFGERESTTQRRYEVPISEFSKAPLSPLTYWTPSSVRELHKSNLKIDIKSLNIEGESIAKVAQGLATGNNDRFLQKFWESNGSSEFIPYAKGGADAWIMPEAKLTLNWKDDGKEIKRIDSSRPQNTKYYGKEGLTWTQSKETGRRFGYFPPKGAFDVKGSMLFSDEINSWSLMGILNSSLYHSLFLSLTPERDWQVGDVGRIPWTEDLENLDEIKRLTQQQYSLLLQSARSDPTSPHYVAPELLIDDNEFFYDHVHNAERRYDSVSEPPNVDYSHSVSSLVNESVERKVDRIKQIENIADQIDSLIYEKLEIPESARKEIETEIEIRTSGSSEQISVDTENIVERQVKQLIHHITLQEVQDTDDGIFPISTIKNGHTLAERIVEKLSSRFGQFADERLVEIDQALGSRSSEQLPYPNIHHFVNNQLFEFHVENMENTPIMWKFHTSRLVSDSTGEGFACLVDYHKLDTGVFDRIQSRYLEPRKALVRERRSAANRRREEESLSASEKATAAEEYARCESGLEQIDVFEERLSELAQSSPREWSNENRQISADAVEKVTEFREETKSRLKTLEELSSIEDVDMSDLFSPSFYETVQKNQQEWIDALRNLETAFRSYSADNQEPVEAHLYDLFEYYDDLVGSTHYASNGILFMTYYFNKFENPEQTHVGDRGVSDRQRLLSELGSGIKQYEDLAYEISEACDNISSVIDSDWASRAHSEITTAGYQPNQKHGVVINIRPLAKAEIVPKIIEKRVI